MVLSIGTQLGSHEITALLGKGGVGEAYRARDLKLKRDVAIKVLPEEFAHDSDRVSCDGQAVPGEIPKTLKVLEFGNW
jgi:eukaryotic-like serine/threonine-protein kinase